MNTAADRCPAKITWVINWHHCSEHCCIMADRCPANTDQTHAEQAPSSNDACTVNVCAIDQQSVRVGVPGRELCCPPCARAARSPRCAGPWNGVPRLRCRENVGQARDARERRQRTTNANWRAATSAEKKKEESSLSSSGQHGRATQSCTGAFLRLPVTAAMQQNAVLHGLLFALARQGSNAAERSLARAPCFACQGRQQHTWQARRSSSTTGS